MNEFVAEIKNIHWIAWLIFVIMMVCLIMDEWRG